MTDISGDDIAALLAQGDLGAFLRLQGRDAHPKPAAGPDPPLRPGAWPTGSQPPTPPRAFSDAEVARALAEYREWREAGEPDGDYRCECDSCRLLA